MIAVLALVGYLLLTSILFGFTCGLHLEFRRLHLMTCRTSSTVEAWLVIGQEIGAFGLSWALGGWALSGAYVGAIILSEITLIRSRSRWTLRAVYGRWRQHRGHEDDCEYGPRERRGGARVRLQSWRKVSLRPVFAPT